jgi:hypothetical protein
MEGPREGTRHDEEFCARVDKWGSLTADLPR